LAGNPTTADGTWTIDGCVSGIVIHGTGQAIHGFPMEPVLIPSRAVALERVTVRGLSSECTEIRAMTSTKEAPQMGPITDGQRVKNIAMPTYGEGKVQEGRHGAVLQILESGLGPSNTYKSNPLSDAIFFLAKNGDGSVSPHVLEWAEGKRTWASFADYKLITNVVVETGLVDGVNSGMAAFKASGKAVTAQQRSAWSAVKTLTAKTKIWGDRPDFVLSPIPAEMEGAEFIWRDIHDQYDSEIKFNLAYPATVWYIYPCYGPLRGGSAAQLGAALTAAKFEKVYDPFTDPKAAKIARMDKVWGPGHAQAGQRVNPANDGYYTVQCIWKREFDAATAVAAPVSSGGHYAVIVAKERGPMPSAVEQIRGGDAMQHTMKGNMGVYLGGVVDALLTGSTISGIKNAGKPYVKGKGGFKDKMIASMQVKNADGTPRYIGNDASGVVVAGSLGVRLKKSTIDGSTITCTGATTDPATTCAATDVVYVGYQSVTIEEVKLHEKTKTVLQSCVSGGYRRLKAIGARVGRAVGAAGAFKNKPAIEMART